MNQNGYGKSVCPHLAGHIGSVYLKCCMIWQHKIALEMVCRADYGFWANVPAQGSGLRRATPQPTPRPGFRPPAQGSGLRRATPQPTTRPRFRAPPGYPPSPPPKIPLVCSSLFGPSPSAGLLHPVFCLGFRAPPSYCLSFSRPRLVPVPGPVSWVPPGTPILRPTHISCEPWGDPETRAGGCGVARQSQGKTS